MISVSDWISIICAVVALIVTVIIAVLQIRQSNRMERFEKRQDKRDEQRHQESVKAQAVSFISKYYKDTGERRHHEIYLSDPRKVAPEKCKTVIRYPIKKA